MLTGKPLSGTNAVIFAGTGELSGALAFELAMEGARVFLTGRDESHVMAKGNLLRERTRGLVEPGVVDAEDQDAVAFFYQSLADRGIHPDVVINGIGTDPVRGMYGRRSDEMTMSPFLTPIQTIVGSQFLTSTLGAIRMKPRRRGTLVLVTSSLARSTFPNMSGITAASEAVQGLARVLAAEYAQFGIRVLCLRFDGIPETRTIKLSLEANARTLGMSVTDFANLVFSNADGDKPLTLRRAAIDAVYAIHKPEMAPGGEPLDIPLNL